MIGRKKELQYLEQLYSQSGNQIQVLYSRGENQMQELVQEFCQGKKCFYYYAPEISAKAQKHRMGQEIAEHYQIVLQEESYHNYFKRIKSGNARKLVLVIEEFQHILKKDEEFAESIFDLHGKKLYPGPVLILLCSTDIPWVEQEMPKALGTGIKKISGKRKIEELNFFVAATQYFPGYTFRQKVEVYGILGGKPEYLLKWDVDRDVKYNVCTHILSKSGCFHNSAERIIRSQLRELSVYHTILESLAGGRRKLNELYKETGFSRAKISVYLKNLMGFDVVEKVSSFETGGWENAQKGLYQIKDTFINFWFKFIYPHLSDLYRMKEEEFYDRYIAGELETYLTPYFTKVCMEYLELLDSGNKLPLQIHKMGTWVGKKGMIDIIAQNSVRENLICLCNWMEPRMTFEMCQQLFRSMEQARVAANYYYLFTAKAFDEKLVRMVSQDSRILLVDMNKII